MSISGLILGVINAAIVGVILLLVGAIIMWLLSFAGIAVPALVQKLYIILVVLVVLYYIVAALLGLPAPGPVSRPFWH